MKRQIAFYRNKLLQDGSAIDQGLALLAQDDGIISSGPDDLCQLGAAVLTRLGGCALILARPPLPISEWLIAHAGSADTLIPPDSETRTFLHDIPILRRDEFRSDPVAALTARLGQRKGVLVEGIGLVAVGPLTLEQAYVNLSSLFHALFVKTLHDLLLQPCGPQEQALLAAVRAWTTPLTLAGLAFCDRADLNGNTQIAHEMERVGRYTVEQRLVDSFFGNISCRDDQQIFISQTAASLDALSGCIDPVPFDNSTTCGITASSELLTHRRIYEQTDARTILHGHPKFAVVLSMHCATRDCAIDDCWRDCPQVRDCVGTPIVAGEVGAGGLADKVVPVIANSGAAIVYGHGVFTIGHHDFAEAFTKLLQIEQACRDEYFRRVDANS
jgi:ribulose-5-phosphate 4-epimerase/fuculose-1-phosphate aldolase